MAEAGRRAVEVAKANGSWTVLDNAEALREPVLPGVHAREERMGEQPAPRDHDGAQHRPADEEPGGGAAGGRRAHAGIVPPGTGPAHRTMSR